MLHVYRTTEEPLSQLDPTPPWSKGTWLNLIAPTEDELQRVAQHTGVVGEFLRAPLDDEERPRIEVEDGQVLIIFDVPIFSGDGATPRYDTIPFGIIVTEDYFVTVCLEQTEIVREVLQAPPRGFSTAKKTRFLLLLLYKTATLYLRYLRQIDRQTDEIEEALQRSTRNEEFMRLLNLQKSLVYFTTSLRANEIVLEKLLRSQLRRPNGNGEEGPMPVIRMYEEDEELLADVITENKQAIEMGNIYSSILTSMMDAFASVISNNLNIVMKFLTSVTVVLALPTMIASFWGMNVPVPFGESAHGFYGVILGAFLVSGAAALVLARRGMF